MLCSKRSGLTIHKALFDMGGDIVAEEEYEEYEEYYEEPGMGKRLWIILFAAALVVALVFGTLWYLRGQDITRLNSAITANQSAASATTARLERELNLAQSNAESGTRKVEELEKKIRDEQRRATDMAQQVERRLRDEADSANARAHELTAQVTRLKAELEGRGSSGASSGEAAGVATAAVALPLHAELEEVKRQLADARESADTREKELYQRLADAVKEKEELAETVGDLKASLNNVGLELTTANEDLQGVDSLQEQAGVLQKQVADARETIRELEEKVGDLEANNSHLRRELTSAQEDLAKASRLSGVENGLTETGKQPLESLSLQSGKPDSERPDLNKEIAAAGAAAVGAAAVKINGLETTIARMAKSLEELKKENAELQLEHKRLQADLEQAETGLIEARAGAAETERLRAEYSTAQKTIEVLRGQIETYESDQESLRKDMTELNLQLQKAQSDALRAGLLESELESAKKTAADSAAQISALTETQTGLRKDLAAAYADLKKAHDGGGDASQAQSELQNRIASLSADLDGAKQQHAAAQESIRSLESELALARGNAADREKSLTAAMQRLEQENNEARERLEAWKSSVPKPESGIAKGSVGEDVHAAIATLEAGNATVDRLEKRIGELEKDNSGLREELARTKADLGDARTNAAKNLAAVREEYNERLANERKRLTERLDVVRDQYQKVKNEAARAKDEAKAKAGEEESGVGMRGQIVLPHSQTPAGAAGILSEPGLEPSLTVKMPESVALVEVIEPSEESTVPMHFYIKDPERSVGEITGIPEKGGFEISAGSRQGVKPGMLFDVHRSLGTMSWFIGVLLVDRTMNDSSETTLVSRTGVKICPVTGRAVLDPAAKYSPYVYADGGKAVPLISAESLGLGGETPAAGDKVDNPYFDPSGKFVFAMDPSYVGMAGREVGDVVEALGGEMMGMDGETGAADYLIVMEEKAESILAEPPHVTPSQLSSYVEL